MKIILATAAIAAGLSLAHGPLDGSRDAAQAGIDRMTTGSLRTPAHRTATHYLLTNPASGSHCQMKRSGGTNEREAVVPERACDAVWPGLAQVSVLSRTGRGLHAFETPGGAQVLALGTGDGVAFEAVEPRNALVSVSELR